MSSASRDTGVDADVAIVGAGPVGLTLACALAQLEVRVRVIEKSAGTKTQPRAAIIWQRAEEDWGRLGVMPRVLEQANPLSGIDVHHGGKRLGGIDLGQIPSEYPHPLILEQHITERLLVDRLRELGVEVEWSTELVDLYLGDSLAVLETEHAGKPGKITANWVVGCEGSRSLVRERAGIAFPGHRRDNLQCLTVDAIPEWRYPEGDRSRGRFFLAPNIALGCFPLPGYDGHAYRFYAFAADERPSRDTQNPTLEEMQSLIARVADAPELKLTLTEPRWLGRARFQDRIAETLRRGRALLAGDSAHVWAPISGHGMNTGILGACNLGWKLAAVVKGEAREDLLDTYSREQITAAKTILGQTRLDFVENIHPAPTLNLLASVLPGALRLELLQRWIDATLSSIPLTHHGDSLLAPAFGEHAHLAALSGKPLNLRSGDRFPFHELNASHFSGYDRWNLLLAAPIGVDSGEFEQALTSLDAIAGQYQAKISAAHLPCSARGHAYTILVRPDSHIGHIGHIGQSGGDAKLTAYLDQILCRR